MELKKAILISLFIALLFTVLTISPVYGGLTVGNGSSVTMGNSTMDMNCLDISISNGGTVNLGDGTIEGCGNLNIETGGVLNNISGEIQMNGAFTLNGDIDIGDGDINFTLVCSQLNTTGGTGDLDGDGINNGNDPDDDNDRMPDVWEINNGINFLKNDAADDRDGDGFSNFLEYREDTNPGDPDSYPLVAMPWIPMLLLN